MIQKYSVIYECEILVPKIPENNSKVCEVLQKTREMNVRLKENST